MQETQVQSLDKEDPLEKGMATHSNILAWRIPWTEEPGGLQSMGSQRVGHDWATSLQPEGLIQRLSSGRIHYCYIILRNVEGKKSLSFLPPWEFQTPLSLGTHRLLINLPRKWLSQYSHLFKNFPQFVVIHTVKGFGVVNKVEVDVFLELSCFFYDPVVVGNLISGSSGFSKSS